MTKDLLQSRPPPSPPLRPQYAFVKENFKTGLSWNPRGSPASAYPLLGGGSAAVPAAAAAAAPPPPAAAPAAAAGGGASSAAAPPAGGKPNLGAMFSEIASIDQSSGRTAGLRHVDKKAVAAEKAAAAPVVPKAPAPAAKAAPRDRDLVIPVGEPLVRLDELRWRVEFHVSGAPLAARPAAALATSHPPCAQVSNKAAPVHVADGTMKQEVYVYACRDAVVYIDSKIKNVRIDTCRDIIVFVHSALSGIEVVNCKKVKIQVQHSVPSLAIDKTDGILVGLSFASREAQLVTSKSSEMNVTFPVSDAEDAEWVEQPIPEQFCSKITAAGKLVTTVSELYTA